VITSLHTNGIIRAKHISYIGKT